MDDLLYKSNCDRKSFKKFLNDIVIVGDDISAGDDEFEKHKCDICDKEFNKYALDIHFATSHNNKETKNENICDKALNPPESHKTDKTITVFMKLSLIHI